MKKKRILKRVLTWFSQWGGSGTRVRLIVDPRELRVRSSKGRIVVFGSRVFEIAREED